ncbi:hypothetical protein [Streptomyces sp. A13(2022)]|uniref:hypothetical protein n=1 Tax=Streptomyces sp. A13(2022) TaxID=2964768 RepID=UPI0021D8C160|nr:hypothetical protein [Streptomyces sp. A13(2022)]MCU8591776.1 hypothetical protein [Streptomyces sp. A13(2022)]
MASALPAAAAQTTVATAIGARLPSLHHYAPDFTATHRTTLYRLPPPAGRVVAALGLPSPRYSPPWTAPT